MVIDCADALTSLINTGIAAGTISSGVSATDTATRTWVPRTSVSDVATVKIVVVPDFRDKTISSRTGDMFEIQPYVMVIKSVDQYSNASVDPWALLTEQIADYVERKTAVGISYSYEWIGQESVELRYDTLMHDGVFWAQIQINYKVFD